LGNGPYYVETYAEVHCTVLYNGTYNYVTHYVYVPPCY